MDGSMAVTVSRRTVPPVTVVEVVGDIDPESAPALRCELRATIDTMGPQVVLDFSRVDFMDSSGLHLLLAVQSWCQAAGGSLRVAAVHGAPARVLDVCAFDQLIDIVPTSESAVENAGSR
jgi:anti-sigma B factor antagonist